MRSEIERLVRHWYRSAEEAWITVAWLRKGKRYADALFFCQLMLEKLLKGLVVLATEEQAPYLHDLVRLANLARITCSESQRRSLGTISGFNLKARYDDQKESFRKQATRAYAEQYLEEAAALRLWLQKKYPPEFANS
jgi:HEPN domain-containing protein